MRITGTSTNAYQQMKATSRQPAKPNSASKGSGTEAPIWSELSTRFDIRRATLEELNTISRELYDAGEISGKEHALLTFNPESSPQWNEIVKGISNPNYFQTGKDSTGRRDWIKEYEARVDNDRRVGNTMGYNNNKGILGLLNRLRRT